MSLRCLDSSRCAYAESELFHDTVLPGLLPDEHDPVLFALCQEGMGKLEAEVGRLAALKIHEMKDHLAAGAPELSVVGGEIQLSFRIEDHPHPFRVRRQA